MLHFLMIRDHSRKYLQTLFPEILVVGYPLKTEG